VREAHDRFAKQNHHRETIMCAIIGAHLESPTLKQIETLKRLFVESQIRGKHACGYSLIRNNRIFTQVAPVPAETFVQGYFAEVQPGDHTLQLIGHCRYSTSDLRYNQPLHVFEDLSIAHNGVVDQRSPIHWREHGYELSTSNDSELLYQAKYAGREPLEEYPEASMAVAELSLKGMRWYRNGKRPLYYNKVANGYFICSTADIALRAGLKKPVRCQPGVVYTPQGNAKIANVEELVP
jgi:glutamine phosphoribosylpyrophosphate amidotransferase